MPYIVINSCYGGFNFTDEVSSAYTNNGGTLNKHDKKIRHDTLFVDIISNSNNYGISCVNGPCSKLEVVIITDEIFNLRAFDIIEYDGCESIKINYDKINKHRILQKLKDNEVLGFNENSTIYDLISTFDLMT